MSSTHQRDGFTLVELMLSLAFFSFILIFVLGGFLLITRNYNRGVTSTRIHQAGRNVMEEMVRELRQSSSTPVYHRFLAGSSGANQGFICFSEGTYRAFDRATSSANYGKFQSIRANLTPACEAGLDYTDSDNIREQWDAAVAGGDNEEFMLNQDEVFITSLNLVEIGSSGNLFRLELSLASANITDNELAEDDSGDGFNDQCSVATSGSEFCDVVSLNTTFSTR